MGNTYTIEDKNGNTYFIDNNKIYTPGEFLYKTLEDMEKRKICEDIMKQREMKYYEELGKQEMIKMEKYEENCNKALKMEKYFFEDFDIF